jgi:alanyl-tRNA synthetase
MQYQKQPDGSFSELPQKNVDFGGGLERILAPANRDPDVFKTDLFTTTISEIENITHRKYQENTSEMRVIADHLRAAVFLIKDGVRPANKEQGYFLRRLIRRAIVKLHQLNSEVPSTSLFTIADEGVLGIYDGLYFNRSEDKKLIEEVLNTEAAKFAKSLDKGLKVLEKADQIDGTFAFDLYQTYGFPLEITVELAQQKGQQVDVEEFKKEFNKHKDLSRTASAGMFKGGLQDDSAVTVKYHTATHLLQAALRKVLGTHVQQKGSNITKDRLRFDFSHTTAVTEDEQKQIMEIIQNWIAADLPVHRQVMSKQQALESGAIAFFIEKYPDEVSVYTIGNDADTDWISKELCGGPHVARTSEIGQLAWQKEQAVAAGIRRIYLT